MRERGFYGVGVAIDSIALWVGGASFYSCTKSHRSNFPRAVTRIPDILSSVPPGGPDIAFRVRNRMDDI